MELRDREKKLGVFVRIEYTTQTEAVVNTSTTKTSDKLSQFGQIS